MPGSFSNCIRRVPLNFENKSVEFFERISIQQNSPLGELLKSTASCSPFLHGLIDTEPEWLEYLVTYRAEDILDELCKEIAPAKPTEIATELRIRKKRLALLTALADLGGVWSLEEVTGALTRFANFSSNTLLISLVKESVRRGKFPGIDPDNDDTIGGIFILAMGKMGAFELNYSSDIDLVVLFDESQHDDDDVQYVKSEFIRVTRRFSKFMSEVTANGYIFRTDLRLRPDPLVNPVCISAGGAMRYYESFARTWERAAFIKARPCAGDLQAGANFLKAIDPFIWRMLLDFAAVRDTTELKMQIEANKGTGDLRDLRGHNLKLGYGGIRQIELFVQTLQMIAGGRNRSLRLSDTLGAMAALTSSGWVTEEERNVLTQSYRYLRTIEHRIQMVRDTQTHSFPQSDEELKRIAALCGESDIQTFLQTARETLQSVHHHTESVYASDEIDIEQTTIDFLKDTDRELIENWQKLPAFRTVRATEIFARLQPAILVSMEQAKNPHEALSQFDSFLRGLPAGVQLFSLFEANPQLIRLLSDTCATTPRLAQYLARNSRVLDAVLESQYFEPFEKPETLEFQLNQELDLTMDYENMLRTARRWLNEQHFRLGIHHLKGLVDTNEAGEVYSNLADATIRSLWPRVIKNFAIRHGNPPGRGAAIVAMGSLGSGTLTSQSDLDLIMIYDPKGVDSSSGAKPLMSRHYYARLTQAFVSAISAPMGEGILYAIDMRLRPSGRQGPVATSLESFLNYQQNEAWTWEHLALTRARAICGDSSLVDDLEIMRKKILGLPRDKNTIFNDVISMRKKLAQHTNTSTDSDLWELKRGRGRMLDIELLSQTCALMCASPMRTVEAQLKVAADKKWLTKKRSDHLQQSYKTLHKVLHVARLTVEYKFSPTSAGAGSRDFLLKQTNEPDIDTLEHRIRHERIETMSIIDNFLGMNSTQ